ncbi:MULTISPECIES: TetR/AcrR family transcriptional regulator [unclassified Modestobacter]|uniref:TetR/AcrR family transcriptional regulator n=1 Tax=unclassified Modestobacter TaxID=2643866 RepID=UPI0022AA598A|nr:MULTISPECIES: TetR/AcrR family transcriptional regulator [unclassified Modestobacter]MCZ2823055.1 helix-turn-helix domain containing protein [Modestobacter sp. VKM Ac-2981]MCZ2851301.1 helix-turn-helix domain containing protein [Modestobacter sp. VKM Ac-2982]
MTDVDLQRPKRRREATVERLLDAALQTFAEQGFAAASVEDICSRGGLTRGAFYSSFRSKDELFEALMTREVERDLARVAELLTGLADEPDPLAAAVDRVLGAFRCDRTWALVVTEYTLHAARNPEAAEVLRRHDEQVGSRLAELVDRMAAEAGLAFTLPAADLIGAATALLSGLTLMSLTAQGDLEPLRRTALLSLVRGAVSSTPTTP